jgi:hypothetical protein
VNEVYPLPMSGRATLVVPGVLVLLMIACTGPRELPGSNVVVMAPSPEPTGGSVMIGIPTEQTLFGPPLDNPSVQPETLRMKGLILRHPRLKVTALPSSIRTVALALEEKSTPKLRWGNVMIPQERRVFRLFAKDRSLGDWLIMITHVDVVPGPSPIPVVAYRWARADVEAYEKCGIPQSMVIDQCTYTFFDAPEMLFIHVKTGEGGQ